jgi:hypothetical protein
LSALDAASIITGQTVIIDGGFLPKQGEMDSRQYLELNQQMNGNRLTS